MRSSFAENMDQPQEVFGFDVGFNEFAEKSTRKSLPEVKALLANTMFMANGVGSESDRVYRHICLARVCWSMPRHCAVGLVTQQADDAQNSIWP